MILYFSGTGNSRYISEVINSILNDEIVCINDYLKNNQKSIFESTKPYIIVCPTYAWRIPRVVEEFISNNVFNEQTGMVMVCPITSNLKVYPTHYILEDTKKVSGSVLCEHIRSIDYEARNLKFVEKLSDNDLLSVIMLLNSCIEE